jgi:Lon protease-like protein
MQDLPVFPLDLVVFPGQSVPLYVFEMRYRRLVEATLALPEPQFVVARAQAGSEATSIADVGTLVRVVELAQRSDGTYFLTAHGGDRVRLRVTRREDVSEADGGERPLFFAAAEAWPLLRTDPNGERLAAWDALEAFRRYARTFLLEPDADLDALVPDDLVHQASFVCANLRLESPLRQRLLEAPSLVDRFRMAERFIDERLASHAPGLGRDA